MFENVIVKTPGESYVNGLTTSNLGVPNYDEALLQHESYVKALKKCGVAVTHLEKSEEFPDSTFVEDTAVLTKDFAIICNPGTESRNKEIVEMEKVLSKFYKEFEYIKSPGYVDGGDVLQIEKKFFIGLSDRTNLEGATQFKKIVEKYNYSAEIVELKEFFHLKTGISYIGENTIVVGGELINNQHFKNFNKIEVNNEEIYASNCIRVNDFVIVPEGYDETITKIEKAGFKTLVVPMSEFRKQDGGLSCLSLRF